MLARRQYSQFQGQAALWFSTCHQPQYREREPIRVTVSFSDWSSLTRRVKDSTQLIVKEGE